MPFLYDTAKHVLLGCLTNLEQFDLLLAIYCYGQLDVLFFCLGSEDSTVFPLGFKKAMTKVARDAFEWNKHMNEEDIQLNIIDALSFLEDCLKDRRLVQ